MTRFHSPGGSRMAASVVAGLLLYAVGGGWSASALAQATNNTVTTSTSSSLSFESPPACSPVGSERSEEAITLEETIGPGTIIIGDRDAGGTAFEVLAGTQNVNVNTHTTTFRCVAALQAVPALGLAGLLSLFGLLAGFGAWLFARRQH
jgi:hypothetical protein